MKTYLLVLIAATVLVAGVAAQEKCGNGLNHIAFQAGRVPSFDLPAPDHGDIQLNCNNAILEAECNTRFEDGGVGGRYLDYKGDWHDLSNEFYGSQSRLMVRNYGDSDLYQELLDALEIQLYLRCDNMGVGGREGCVSFTVDAPKEPLEPCRRPPLATPPSCPPKDPEALKGKCEYAAQFVPAWDSGYTVRLQFKSTVSIDEWKLTWKLPGGHDVVPSPWNLKCHKQTGMNNVGFSYPTNGDVEANVVQKNIGFNVEMPSGASPPSADQLMLTLNGEPCTKVPFMAEPPVLETPPDKCEIVFSSIKEIAPPEFPMPHPEQTDAVINCEDPILASGCNAITVNGFNGRYLDSNGQWQPLGNIFYPTQSGLAVRYYIDEGLRDELIDSDAIQVYTRCDNGGWPETSCVEFTVRELEKDEEIDSCGSSSDRPNECPPDAEFPSFKGECYYAFNVRNDWDAGWTVDFQFWTESATLDHWLIDWETEGAVQPSPWNVNCWTQVGIINTGYSYGSNGAVVPGEKVGFLGYTAERNNDTDSSEITMFYLNGQACNRDTYTDLSVGLALGGASLSASGAGVAAGVAAAGLLVAGIAIGRRLAAKPSRNGRGSRSNSLRDTSEASKGDGRSRASSVTSRTNKLA